MKLLLPISQTFNVHVLKLSKYRELIEVSLLSLLSFIVPVYLGYPQLLVGIIINALLVRTSLTTRNWKVAPVILLPSLGALTRGVLFGTFTIYLVYLVPVIWLGNLTISYSSKLLCRKNTLAAVIIPSIIKTVTIFLPTLVLVKLTFMPELFLKAMGMVQLITALAGATIAIGITRLEMLFSRKLISHNL